MYSSDCVLSYEDQVVGDYRLGFVGNSFCVSPNGILSEITALQFDPLQELLWGGNSQVLSSYMASNKSHWLASGKSYQLVWARDDIIHSLHTLHIGSTSPGSGRRWRGRSGEGRVFTL